MRWLWLIGSLVAAFVLAVVTARTPAPAPASAPATAFSAERAMIDVREIAQRPHPIGSPDHARVQTVLLQRLRDLGLQVSTHDGPLTEGAKRFQRQTGIDPAAANVRAVNLIGLLPGRDPALPAVALMAHYDTTPHSPGAADDSAGVAAILETVRALRARGPADRTLIVLFTDAEELALDGAAAFFAGHPLRDRIGTIINLEARGGGGRAWMFETGPDNAQTVDLFAGVAPRVTGGVSSNSLSVFVYETMPNSTDYTLAKARGIPGLNFGFIGRPGQYHTPVSTPENLDLGSVQHIGSQALETADALLRAPALPAATRDAVYSDLLGLVIVAYPAVVGWVLLGLAVVILAVAVWRARRLAGLGLIDMGRGALDGVWFLTTGFVVAQAVRAVAGHARLESSEAYYTMMARLPWLEVAVGLALLAVALAAFARHNARFRLALGAVLVVATIVTTVLSGFSPIVVGAAVVALGLSVAPGLSARSTWGGWTGLIALVLAFGLLAQILAPPVAYVLVWPALLAALAVALGALVQPGLTRAAALAPPAVAAIVGGAWVLGLAHFLFLAIGIDLPGSVALPGLLVLMLVRPLAPELGASRGLVLASAACLVLGLIVSVASQFAVPTLMAMN